MNDLYNFIAEVVEGLVVLGGMGALLTAAL